MEKRGMQFVRYADGHVMIRKEVAGGIAAQADLSAEEWDEVVEHMDQVKAELAAAAPSGPVETEDEEKTPEEKMLEAPPAPKAKVPAKKKAKSEAPTS